MSADLSLECQFPARDALELVLVRLLGPESGQGGCLATSVRRIRLQIWTRVTSLVGSRVRFGFALLVVNLLLQVLLFLVQHQQMLPQVHDRVLRRVPTLPTAPSDVRQPS